MYAIAQREELRKLSTIVTDNNSNNNNNDSYPKNTIRLYKADATLTFEDGGKRPAWQKHHRVRVHMHDLLSDYVNPKEELHMTLSSIGYGKSSSSSSSAACGRRSYCRREPTSFAAFDDENNTTSKYEKRKSVPLHSTTFFQSSSSVLPSSSSLPQNIVADDDERIEIRMKGELYPRYRLDTIFNDDGTVTTCNSTLATSNSCVGRAKVIPSSSATTTTQTVEDDDRYILRSSPSFIKEQEAILARLATNPHTKSAAAVSTTATVTATATVTKPTRTSQTNNNYNNVHHDINDDPIQRKLQNNNISNNQKKKAAANPSSKKTTSKTTHVKIFDQRRVHEAINKGTAMVTKCLGCNKHMLATTDIKLVVCPGCGTVSPIELGSPGGSNRVI